MFTFNKMNQYPVPYAEHEGKEIELIVTNIFSKAGKYEGQSSATAWIKDQETARKFNLKNNTQNYEILKKDLTPKFETDRPDFAPLNHAITIVATVDTTGSGVPINSQFSTRNSQLKIQAYATGNTIILQNVPKGAKINVYNLLGERVYSRDAMHRVSTKGELQITVPTKGMYIAKIGNQILRVAVR